MQQPATLPPWADGPFELLLHAEMHLREGDDFDRRIALIGFDNAIEVAITTYLTLHPVQRQNRSYQKQDVERWLENYHTKLEFLESEAGRRGAPMLVTKADIIWYHNIRNDQYHGGSASIPKERDLTGIRKASLWVFSLLFDVADPAALLDDHIAQKNKSLLPAKDPESDRLIDREFGTVEIAGRTFYTSEVLYGVDPVTYSELAEDLREIDGDDPKGEQ